MKTFKEVQEVQEGFSMSDAMKGMHKANSAFHKERQKAFGLLEKVTKKLKEVDKVASMNPMSYDITQMKSVATALEQVLKRLS